MRTLTKEEQQEAMELLERARFQYPGSALAHAISDFQQRTDNAEDGRTAAEMMGAPAELVGKQKPTRSKHFGENDIPQTRLTIGGWPVGARRRY